MPEPSSNPTSPDVLTTIALAIVAYAICNVVHEGVGHGGACLLVGCTPRLWTAAQFQGDASGLPEAANRIIAAGGSIANLCTAAVALAFLRRARATAALWLCLWLVATISLLQATGYLLFSGVGNVGDWAEVVRGWPGGGLWRVAMAGVGGGTYWLATRWGIVMLGRRLRAPAPARVAEAYRYTLVAYVSGAALYVAAGAFDPGGLFVLFISAAAASLGGTSGLAWGPQMLKDPALAPPTDPLPVLGRDWRWVTAAAVIATLYVLVLGPGVRF